MSVAQTKAAAIMQDHAEELSSHQVISLLLDGALERVAQAKQCVNEGNEEDSIVLIQKLVGIINGLRASLNMEEGGEIAVNLENLYNYMIGRLCIDVCGDENTLTEVGQLISEVKTGWDGISDIELKQSA